MPSGSGIDSGTKILDDESDDDKFVLATAFHHMDEGGGYDGWTEHKIIVIPQFLLGFSLKITGINRNDIKTYLADVFYDELRKEY